MTPEMYAAVAYKTNGFLVRAGADLVSIKPRVYGKVDGVTVPVSDRKTSLLYYIYTQYSYKSFSIKANIAMNTNTVTVKTKVVEYMIFFTTLRAFILLPREKYFTAINHNISGEFLQDYMSFLIKR